MDEDEIEQLLREIEEREDRTRPEDELPDGSALPGCDNEESWD